MPHINKVLLSHLVSGDGPAVNHLKRQITGLRPTKKSYEDFIRNLTIFLEARTDARRLIYSQKVAETLLKTHYLQEMTKLRRKVADFELQRIMEYKKQRDHTAHTLYLFLLGIWLYDSVPIVRDSYNANTIEILPWSRRKPEAKFLFQWLYASILHDLGYVFSDVGPTTIEYRRSVDDIFGLDWLRSEVLSGLSGKRRSIAERGLSRVYEIFNKTYGDKCPRKTSDTNEPIEILNRLKHVPWLNDLGLPQNGFDDGFTAFSTKHRDAEDLRRFADDLARLGFQKDGKGSVDHAVSGGLLLLQYTSYWYWLMDKLRTVDRESSAIIKTSYYPLTALPIIIKACRAVAYHNIDLPNTDKRFDIDNEPLIFLSILCDELSTWERFPAAKDLSSVWNEENFLESTDIVAAVRRTRCGPIAEFTIKNSNFLITRITDSLNKKLVDWQKVVSIKGKTKYQK